MMPDAAAHPSRADSRDRLSAGAIFGLFILLSAVLMTLKPIWYDEFFTLYYAQFATWAQYGEMLKHGGDTNPPLLHLVARASMWIFGDTEWGLRLPFLLAYAAASWQVGRMASRRAGPAYGLLAMALVWVKFRYAYEARSYALVLFGVTLAVSGWLDRMEGRRSRSGLARLLIGGLIATTSHFYGLLLLGPLGLAEGVRGWRRRRVDLAVWGALLACGLSLAALVPVFQSIQERMGSGHPAAVHPWSLIEGYAWYVGGLPRVVAAALLLAVCYVFFRRKPVAPTRPLPRLTVHEWVLWLGLAALPVGGFLLAWRVTGVFFARHFIAAIIGIAMLAAMGAHRLFQGRAAPARVLAGLLCAIIVAQQVREIPRHQRQWRKLVELEAAAAGVEDSLPLLVIDYPEYPQYVRYWSPSLAARIVCVLDAGRHGHPDYDLRGLSRYAPLRVILTTELADWPQERFHVIESGGVVTKRVLLEDLSPGRKP